jgi:hypothetical protein
MMELLIKGLEVCCRVVYSLRTYLPGDYSDHSNTCIQT